VRSELLQLESIQGEVPTKRNAMHCDPRVGGLFSNPLDFRC